MSKLYDKFVQPMLFKLDAEKAHELGISTLRSMLSTDLAQRMAAKRFACRTFGTLERFGLEFSNPLGVAAGFDKNGIAVNQLASLGFGFVEVGTVTFEPQKGNKKPRLFRLPKDHALINRLGFNNDGAIVVAERLKKLERKCVVGVNIGKNKDVPIEEATENYLESFELVHSVADYIAVNISSPNTPNLRELQRSENLEELLSALQSRNRELSKNISSAAASAQPPKGGTPNLKPILIKIAPDLAAAEIEAVVDICIRHDVAGIIATNTTVSREGLRIHDVSRFGEGGVSGKPLTKRSNEVISMIYRYSKGRLPIMGVGGIFTAQDAFEKIVAGASLLQVYTGFVYGGPGFARDINTGLDAILDEKGFARLDEAVGTGALLV